MCQRITNDLSCLSGIPASSLFLLYDPEVQQAEGLTELTVFAFESLRAGARVTVDAISTLALILAGAAFTLVAVCKGRIWKLRLRLGLGHHQQCVDLAPAPILQRFEHTSP